MFVVICYSSNRRLINLLAPVRGLLGASCPGASSPASYLHVAKLLKNPIKYSTVSSPSQGRLAEKTFKSGCVFLCIPIS